MRWGGAAQIQVPPSLPDISGTYLLDFGTGPSGALAVASLTVTLKQTEWLNGINTDHIVRPTAVWMPWGYQSDHNHRRTSGMERPARKVRAVHRCVGGTKHSHDDRR
jgi:hypothetical protein